MEKMPKNKKNLEYHIERMTRNGEDYNRRTEYVVNDWAKQVRICCTVAILFSV